MRRKAIIFHGTGGHPQYCWYPWLGARLEARGYAVELPHYPGLNLEPIRTFLPTVLASHVFDEATVLVGHSGGAALLLALLEQIENRVAQAILVAGYATPPNRDEEPILQETYDWQSIKAHVSDLYFINSVRDPYAATPSRGGACSRTWAAHRSSAKKVTSATLTIRTRPSSCWTGSSTRRSTCRSARRRPSRPPGLAKEGSPSWLHKERRVPQTPKGSQDERSVTTRLAGFVGRCARDCRRRSALPGPGEGLAEEREHALREQRGRLVVMLGEIVLGAGIDEELRSGHDRRRAPARTRSPHRPRGCAAAAARLPATSPASCRPTGRAAGRSNRAPRRARAAASGRATAPAARRGRSRRRRPRAAATRRPRGHDRRSPSARRSPRNGPDRPRSCRTSGRRRGRARARCGRRRATRRRNGGRGRRAPARGGKGRPQPGPRSVRTR